MIYASPLDSPLLVVLSVIGVVVIVVIVCHQFGRLLCWFGLHRSNYSGNAFTFAPARIRCERCGVLL